MSKINVNRRGPSGEAGIVTLEHLRPGETFRFPRSAPGTVYQLLAVSDRLSDEGGVDISWDYVFSNVSTGRLFGTDDVRTVVPVSCSLTARERTNTTPARRSRRSSSTSSSRSSRSTRSTRRRSR